MSRILIVCTTDSMIWNFLIPHVKELEKNGHYIECACSQTGVFFNDLADKYQIKMNRVPFKRSPYSFKNIVAYKCVRKLIREKAFDTIFCHEPVGGAIGRLAGHKERCRVVYMAHGFHFYKGAPKSRIIYYWIEKWLSRYTDTLITINNEDYEISQTFNAKKCIKIDGVGIDTSKFIYDPNHDYLRKELKIDSNTIIFLSIGELIKRKNHKSFIKAIALCNDSRCIYVIAGDGEREQSLKKLVTKLQVENKVFFLGYRRDINNLCNAADIFVIPSIHEGLSVALMEAMACGKPVIASKIRGNVDLIIPDKGGLLVNTFDVNGYKDAIKEITNSPKNYATFNMHYIENYDVKYIVKKIGKIFEQSDFMK